MCFQVCFLFFNRSLIYWDVYKSSSLCIFADVFVCECFPATHESVTPHIIRFVSSYFSSFLVVHLEKQVKERKE